MYRYLLIICLILCLILPANAASNITPSTTCKPTFVYVTVTVPPAAQPTPQIIYVPVAPVVTQTPTIVTPSVFDKLPKNSEYIIYGLLFLSLVIGMIAIIRKKNKTLKKPQKKILEITTNIDELYEETPEPVEELKPVQDKETKPKKPKKPISLLDQDFEF